MKQEKKFRKNRARNFFSGYFDFSVVTWNYIKEPYKSFGLYDFVATSEITFKEIMIKQIKEKQKDICYIL